MSQYCVGVLFRLCREDEPREQRTERRDRDETDEERRKRREERRRAKQRDREEREGGQREAPHVEVLGEAPEMPDEQAECVFISASGRLFCYTYDISCMPRSLPTAAYVIRCIDI